MRYNRKKFIKRGLQLGTLLTVPNLLEYCSTYTPSHRNVGQYGDDPIRNAEWIGLKSPILKALNVGITAPNPHNTQAWKFRIESDLELLLFVDEKRLLPQTDPSGRQIHIGQGCFLEHLRIGANKIGYNTKITLFPEGEYTYQDSGKKPVAKVVLEKDENLEKDVLFNAILNRATNRSIYEGNLIQEEEFQKILSRSRIRFSSLKFINSTENLNKYKEFLKKAFEIETNTYSKHEESRAWFRYNDEEIYKFRDGISLRGNGLSGAKLWMVENFFLKEGQEIWHSESNRKGGIDIFIDQIESTKALVLFKTKENSMKDWIQVGMDYARFQLSLTESGLVMQPLSQILQEYPEMDSLRKELDTSEKIVKNEKIQMIVRLGRSGYKFLSPRRDPKSMIL
ncbi:MAG: hypothetical protein H7A24_14675 [Leptospiraceae bacterium]|nr:hypothetical protein [Leptospiraceae bacterium]